MSQLDAGPNAVAPLMPGEPLLGSLRALTRDPFKLLVEATHAATPWMRLRVLGQDIFVPGDPAVVEHLLVTNARNYDKKIRSYDILKGVVGRGLVTSDGEFWKKQRRIAQPAFHRERIAGFGEAMRRSAMEMVDRLPFGQEFDLAATFNHVTLKLVGETLLSSDVTDASSTVEPSLVEALRHTVRRSLDPFSAPPWLPTANNRRFRAAMAELDSVVNGVIAARRAGGPAKHDLLAMLMESRDPETGEGMSDAQLRDEVMTIFLAGFETTATTLSWTTMLVGQHPHVETAIVEELERVVGDRPLTLDEVPKLTYLGQVIKESMRLYPPAWSFGRRVVADEVVGGVQLKAGTTIFVVPYAMQRHPKYWPEPERFWPERWSPEAPAPPRGAYFPFSIGQRKCIGDAFAMLETTIILATLYQRVSLRLSERAVPFEALTTLRPSRGVWFTATRRPGSA